MFELFSRKRLFSKFLTQKQAQVTAFVITGIVILAIAAFAIIARSYLSSNPFGNDSTESINFVGIDTALSNCLEKVSSDALQTIGRRGFHYQIPNETGLKDDTTLWLFKTINIMPSNFEFIEGEMEEYMDDYFPLCVPMAEFEREGWDIKEYSPEADVEINNNSVSFNIDLDLEVEKDGVTKKFDSYNYVVDLNFRDAYAKLAEFVNYQLLLPSLDFNNPVGDYNELSEDANYYFESTPVNDTIFKITMTDYSGALLQGNPWKVTFAADIRHNDITRYYDEGSTTLFSAERLAMLFFMMGSSFDISIRSYLKDKVVREKTTAVKVNADVTEWKDIDLKTDYPIYRFGPNGAKLNENEIGVLSVWKNQDQIHSKWLGLNQTWDTSEFASMFYNGKEGWVPFPHVQNDTGIDVSLSTSVSGFSEFTMLDCASIGTQEFDVVEEISRGLFEVLLPVILLIIAIVLIIVTAGSALAAIGPLLGATLPAGATITVTVGGLAVATVGSVGAAIGVLAVVAISAVAVGAVAAKMAMDGFAGMDSEKTIIITTYCDGEFDVEEIGDCKSCTLTEVNDDPGEVSGAQASPPEGHALVNPTKTYTLTATADLSWPETSATCTCRVTGNVITNMDYGTVVGNRTKAVEEYLDDPQNITLPPPSKYVFSTYDPENLNLAKPFVGGFLELIERNLKDDFVYAEGTSDPFNLGCCVTTEGTCLDNYYGPYCDGDIERHSCIDVERCPEYIDFAAIFEDILAGARLPTGEHCTFIYGSEEPDLDIYISGVDYNQTAKYAQDVSSIVVKLMDNDNLGNVNFYRIDKQLSSSQVVDILNYSQEECMGIAPKKLVVALHDDPNIDCSQAINVVDTKASIRFIPELDDASLDKFTGSFCMFVDDYTELMPPEVTIKDVSKVGSKVRITFRIDDEQSNASYAILAKDATWGAIGGLPIYEGVTQTGVDVTKEVSSSDTPGETIYYLKVQDLRGQLAQSDEKSILTPGIVFGYSSVSPIQIDSAGRAIDLDSAISLYDTGDIIRRTYTSTNLDCLDLSYDETSVGGYVTLIANGTDCESMIEVEVETEMGYTGSGELRVVVE